MAKLLRYNLLFMIWHVLKNDVHKLEYDPRVQWRYHIIMTRYWVANFAVVIVLFFVFPHVWIAIALFLNTIYSLYANLATDFGAVPASYAAMKAKQIQEAQEEATEQKETAVHDVTTVFDYPEAA